MTSYSVLFEGSQNAAWNVLFDKYRPFEKYIKDAQVSGLYDLFPDENLPDNLPITGTWPDRYPHDDKSGLYFIYSEKLTLLYIGKSTGSNSSIGGRLGSYFKYVDYPNDKRCMIRHNWKDRPRFINCVAPPEDLLMETESLELFLVNKFNPPDNTSGKL